jgi:kumamolisin
MEENTMTETHVIVPGSERVPIPGSQVIARANLNTVIDLTLKLRRKKPLPELTSRPDKAMTREELASNYGASEEDIAKVITIFEGLGFKIREANAATRTVLVSAPIRIVEEAFQLRLFNYAHEDGDYRGRVGPVYVPAEVGDIVQGVFGLDTRRVARRKRQPIGVHARRRRVQQIPSSWYTPGELAAHYQFPDGDGSGQTIALLEFGGGFFQSDLNEFCTLANVSAPNVITVSTDGTPTDAKDGAEGEVMLDIEVVAGVCPKSTIVVYFADFTEQGWITILDAVMQDSTNNPGVVSVSWGFAEDALIWTDAAMNEVNQSLLEAANLGITVCVAAGDDGSSDAISDGLAHVDFPSSSPYVLAVGGTTIPSKTGDTGDIVWKEGDGLRSDGGGSTGGGVSAVFDRPTWQSSINISSVNPGAIDGRVVPDIAANADWDASPYLLVVDGNAEANGGTSAATPLWASLIALINEQQGGSQRLGYVTPLLYQPASSGTGTIGEQGCTDITSGDNTTDQIGGYSATVGYDAVSGWGTPNGTQQAAALLSQLPQQQRKSGSRRSERSKSFRRSRG